MLPSTHVHHFTPGTNGSRASAVLLHGSGGSEVDLLPLASDLVPEASKLAIRGTVRTDGGYAFFMRFPDSRVDEADVATRAPGLASFIEAAGARYGRDRPPITIGYSNGAIMAAALLLTDPGLLAAAVLFRPLSPFTDDLLHRLDGTPVLIVDGANDDRRRPGDGLRLAERLARAGARVTHHVLPVGHAHTAEDSHIARQWLGAIAG